jgi:cbb3-type cytochrome oxidase maturation protein
MTVIMYLIPIALTLGLLSLVAFFWSLKSGQFEDLDGAAHRMLRDDSDEIQ